MTQVIARVHPVHLINVEQVAADPRTRLITWGCEPACWLLLSISAITIIMSPTFVERGIIK